MGRLPTTGKQRGVLYYIGLGLSGGVFALVVLFGIIAVAVPAFAHATPMTVLTGSMEPRLPPGTLVIVKPVDPSAIRIGDVVTYQIEPNKPGVITHRVTEIIHSTDGSLAFTTKGDNNDMADAAPVKSAQVVGKLWYSIPWVGYVNNLVGQQRGWLVPAVAVALFLYAGYLFLTGAAAMIKKRRTKAVLTQPLEPADPVASGTELVDTLDGTTVEEGGLEQLEWHGGDADRQ